MKIMRTLIIATLFISSLSVKSLAQETDTTVVTQTETQQPQTQTEKPKQSKKDRIYYGGNIGLSFGSYTSIGVYPLLGYKVTPKLSAGVQLSYQYISDNRYSSTYNTSNYGGSLFARYRIIPPLYAHIEYAQMNYELYNQSGSSSREWVPYLFAGGGYSQRVGGNAWVNFQVLFDLLQDSNSPYNDWEPFFSIGVGVGF